MPIIVWETEKRGESSLKQFPYFVPTESLHRVGLTADVCRFSLGWGHAVDKQTLLSFCLVFV